MKEELAAISVMGDVLHICIFGKHVVKGDIGDYRLKTNRRKAEGTAPICGIYAPLRQAEAISSQNSEPDNVPAL